MAVSITTTYAGEFAGKYIAAALLSAPTIENGGVTVIPNVKFKYVIQKFATDDIVKDATCDFDQSGTVTLTERILQTEDFQVNLTLCKKTFHSTWQSMEMGYSSFDQLPKSFADYLIAYAAEKVASNMESTIWVGVNATAGQFAGIMTQIAADAALPAAQEVAGTTVTSSNVIVELGKLVDGIPARLYGKEGLRLYVSQNIAKAYVRALGGFAASGVGANGMDNQGTMWYANGALSFDGIPIFMANGMAANTALATTVDNLYFGTSLLSDLSEVKVLDMSDLDGSNNVRVIMKFAAGATYGWAEDMVTYGYTNSAN
jgi:hypothetical protein